jgi:hypothetical protein
MNPVEGNEPRKIRISKVDVQTGERAPAGETEIKAGELKLPKLQAVRRTLPDGKTVGDALEIPKDER